MKETHETPDPIADFRRAAMAKGDGVGLPVARDRAWHGQMARAVAILREQDDQGRGALRALASDPSPHVRQWAAAELLSRGDTSVVPILEELAAERGGWALNAEVLLEEHRAGRLVSPFPPS